MAKLSKTQLATPELRKFEDLNEATLRRIIEKASTLYMLWWRGLMNTDAWAATQNSLFSELRPPEPLGAKVEERVKTQDNVK